MANKEPIDYSSFVNEGKTFSYQKEYKTYGDIGSGINRLSMLSSQPVAKTRVVERKAKVDRNFNDIMAGHAEQSEQYIKNMDGILSSYGGYINEFKGRIQPIADALEGNIDGLEKYISDTEDYNKESQKFLADNQDLFLNGIVVDPNSNRTRAEYTGAISDQYATAREGLKRSLSSQGLGVSEGAERELAMNRARDLGMATGQAYSDWRSTYNADTKLKQQGIGDFMGLRGGIESRMNNISLAKAGAADKKLDVARLNTDSYNNILSAQMKKTDARANWNKDLLGYNTMQEDRLLELQQNKANTAIQDKMTKTQMEEGLKRSKLDEWNLSTGK